MAEPTLEFHPARGGLMLNRGGNLVKVDRVIRLDCGDRLMVQAADDGRDYQFAFDDVVRAYTQPAAGV